MVDRKLINKILVFIFIGFLLFGAVFVLKPILLAIFSGAFFAYILHPLYNPIRNKIKSPNLSTFIFILLLILVIGIPLYFFIPTFAREIFNTYLYFQKIDLSSAIGSLLGTFLNENTARLAAVQANLFITKFFNYSLEAFAATFSNLPDLLLKVAVFLFTFYFSTRDSEKIKVYVSELSPLSKATEEKFATEFRHITNSIVFGHIIIGIIQGLCLALGLIVLGVPKVFFLTMVTIIVSIIPVVGAWLVWIPVSLYLVVSGQVLNGTILFFYGLLFVSTIDNFLRPYFVSRKSNLNIFVAVIGTIGGLYAFGVIGLLLGPLVLSYLIIVIEFYKQGKLNELFRE